MASTYLAPTCKPWLRFHRDTWRVNKSPREAREHFASRLKAWVRFRPRMFFFVFCFFSKNGEEAIPPPPLRRASRLKAWVRFRPRMGVFFLLFRRGPDGVYLFSTHMQATYNSMFARLGSDYDIRNQWFFAILEAMTTY